jgi:hypothetical protein
MPRRPPRPESSPVDGVPASRLRLTAIARPRHLIASLLLGLAFALSGIAPASAATIPQPQPIVGTWQFEGARINVVGSSGIYYGAVVSGSYGGCGEKVPPGDIAWKSLSGTGLFYSGRTPWFNTDGCFPIGDGPLSINLSDPNAGSWQSKSPDGTTTASGSITRIGAPYAWMTLPLAEVIPKPSQRKQFESAEPYSEDYYEVVFDEEGMPHFVPSKSHSSSSNCTCVSGATLIAFTEMLAGGQPAIDRLLGKGASCKAKFSALLRSEMGANDRSLAIRANGTSKAARAKLAAKLQATIAQRIDLAACLKKKGASDTVTGAEAKAAAAAMQAGAIPAELSAALRSSGASAGAIDLLRLRFFTKGALRKAKGKFPASLASPKDLDALRKTVAALRR